MYPALSPLEVLDLQAEPREPLVHRAVELRLVLVGRRLVQRPREIVAQFGEDLGARLDEILVVAESLLGLVALGPVVGGLGLVALADQLRVVPLEELELP